MQHSDNNTPSAWARLWPISYAIPPVAWAGVIFLLSSVPASGYEDASRYLAWLPWRSYFVHGGLYFILGGLTLRLLHRARFRLGWLTAAQSAVLIATSYGLSDEYHQTYVDGRDFSLLDLLADLLGACAAAGAWAAWGRIRSDWRAKRA